MAEMMIGTQYDINKQGFESGMIKPMLALEAISKLNDLGKWAVDMTSAKYFMLLNREAYDFTVFNNLTGDKVKLSGEVQEVLESRGEIALIEYNDEQQVYEIWVECNEWMKMRAQSDYVMFLFFPCNSWVIEV